MILKLYEILTLTITLIYSNSELRIFHTLVFAGANFDPLPPAPAVTGVAFVGFTASLYFSITDFLRHVDATLQPKGFLNGHFSGLHTCNKNIMITTHPKKS
jgi:hypothetical protein